MKNREPHLTSAEKVQNEYRYSSALRCVGCSLEFLRKEISRDPRKTIPVAALARKFDVSTRLLWKWIADGLLSAVRGKQNANEFKKKSGVPKRAALNFLKNLEGAADFANQRMRWRYNLPDYLPLDRYRPEIETRTRRPDVAQKKIRESRLNGIDGKGMNPRQFADAVGVSRSAVWRAIKSDALDWWNPTPHRTLIGKRPKTPRKVGKRHKSSLTRKNR